MATLLLAALAVASAAPSPAARAQVDVPVLSHQVERGDTLAAGDFSVEKRPAAQARGGVPVAEAAGQQAARRLAAGTVVRQADLMRPQVIRRGEAVTIALRSGGLSITTSGKALTGGGVGDPVRVVSLATNRTLDATIESSGHVRLIGQ